MKRTLVNLLIELSAALLFLAMLATGFVLRFTLPPGTNRALSLWGLTRHQWGGIHFWISGALLAVLLVHQALHWQWVVTVVGKQLGLATSPQKSNLRSGAVAALAVAAAFSVFAWASYRGVRELEAPCCDEHERAAVPQVARPTERRDATENVKPKVDFWKDVYPIFKASCISCHGPKRAAGAFRADRREDFFRPDSGKPLVVPGDSSASPLTAILSGARKDIAWPDRHRLPEKQLAVVKGWIDAGAPWPDRPEEK
jgi:mono/diheme cytochrome c family protein